MEDRSIADVQITASSFKSDGGKTYKPQYGRLNNKPSGAMGGAWCADVSDTSRYLQIDLKTEMTLSGISTQGQSDEANWVVKYKIQHSLDGVQWRDFKEFGQEKVSSQVWKPFVEMKALKSTQWRSGVKVTHLSKTQSMVYQKWSFKVYTSLVVVRI